MKDNQTGHAGVQNALDEKNKRCLDGSLLHYVALDGVNVVERSAGFSDWCEMRWQSGVFPYGRIMASKAGPSIDVVIPDKAQGSDGPPPIRMANFASQDYLGLGQSKRVAEAAIHAVEKYGVHSAGSPAFIGRSQPVTEIEQTIARLLSKETALIYATGWAAGYGVISGLVRNTDTIVMDALAHSCLQEGATRATPKLLKFRHNDVEDLRRLLADARQKDPESGVFLIIESLYSMDADGPPLAAMLVAAREFKAITILDVAHDFGSMGPRGLGALEEIAPADYPEVIMGSFSKTFAANGGFVACHTKVKNYLYYYSSPHLFSNAISPIQACVIRECLKIVFDEPLGKELRVAMFEKARLLRGAMVAAGCQVGGKESPIVPIFVGPENKARIISLLIQEKGIAANLVEFPAVPRGKARFRFQIMATHEDEALLHAARCFGEALATAEELMTSAKKVSDG